ncbi:MAG TPA: hypothetical protein DCR03_06685 [Gammaproteobacteria bacterium]|nr:hypothetical protein [Gammaproteobacteria bacterium]
MFRKYYRRSWPFIFLAFGLLSATGTHIHFNLAGLAVTGHNLMWFLMAFAHAHVFWPTSTSDK